MCSLAFFRGASLFVPPFMKSSSLDTVSLADSTQCDTKVGDVFAPHVQVRLHWNDIEAAVQKGAIHPAEAHA